MLKTLSVVIPTFNRPEATLRAIHSALGQTRPPDEIIVVDDASDPPFHAGAFAIHDSRIKILSLSANGGASAARQAGVDAASGDIIAFLDSDDQWFPDKLASQVALLQQSKSPLTAVSCGWLEEGVRSKTRMPISSKSLDEFASGCWFAPGSTVVIPKAAFNIVGPFDPDLRRLEDLDWFIRFALHGGQLAVAAITGASISIGRRGRGAPVEEASSRILERFSGTLEPSARQRLAAYLELERAVAARNDGRYGRMAVHLARSFMHFPRLSLHLQQWWQQEPDT